MKNNILKKLSILMAFMFIFIATSIPVFAATPSISKDAPTKGSITITKNGATFTAYKILSATQSGDAYEYSPTSEFKGFFNNSKYGSYSENNIQNLDVEQTKQFSIDLHKYVIDNNISGQELSNGKENTVNLGYYLVSETSSNSEGAAVASAPILVSVPEVSNDTWNYNITIQPKDNTPTLEKNIIENNKKVKASSNNIGDVIKYQVNATIPTYQSNAKNIMYKFTDTMSKGLTYDEATGFKITSGNKVFSSPEDYTINTEKQSDGSTVITIDFVYENIKAYVETGITLNYQATLNNNAVVSTETNAGNPNTIELYYTNNPNVENSYKTLTDKVTSYTWGFGIKKVDSNDNSKALKGAEFSIKDSKGNILASYTYNENGQVVPLTGKAVTDSNGVTTFTGLEEGNYIITEEKAPNGYSLLKDPIDLRITANKDVSGNYNGAATINISNSNEAASIIDDITEADGNVLFNVQIENFEGFSLPNTGGLGTTGFIKIAIILLSVVCVLAILGLGYAKLENSKKTKN